MYRPIKVRYPENHPFFQDADLLYAKTIKNSSIGFYDTLIGKNQLKKNKFVSKFPCGVNGCKVHFISVEKYMMHYEAAHRFACSICNLSLPSPRYLDIHLREVHDNFFLAQNERQPMYECLIENCPYKFSSHLERGEHLVNMHNYPSDFNDIIIGKKYVKQNNHKKKKKKKKKKMKSNKKSSLSCNNNRRKNRLCV
mgnify:CR=1 FL=1